VLRPRAASRVRLSPTPGPASEEFSVDISDAGISLGITG
jgi:hypothetical protein